MRIYLPNPSSRMSIRVRAFSRNFKLKVIVERGVVRKPLKLVMLGDGSPDDVMVAIVANHLDGGEVVALVKPKVPREAGIVDALHAWTRAEVSGILAILDQETTSVDEVMRAFEDRLRVSGVRFERRAKRGRVATYACSIGPSRFEVILVVNGLEEQYIRHTVEDHFLEAAKRSTLRKVVEEALRRTRRDPKRAWSLLGEKRGEVFGRLVKDPRLAERSFPQQFKAFRGLLREAMDAGLAP